MILETYFLVYLLLLVFFGGGLSDKNCWVYFGLVNLFSSVVLLLSLLLNLSFLTFFSVLGKMGSFPLVEWVVFFLKKMGYIEAWFFFSLNKMIPLYMMSEFLKNSLVVILLFFLLKLFISFKGAFSSLNFMSLVGWSSVSSSGFFVILAVFLKKFYYWFSLLLLYSALLFFLFFLSEKGKKSLFLVLFLFGLPPVSMFLFKMAFIIMSSSFYSMLWTYLLVFSFFIFGSSYFFFFLKESLMFMNLTNFSLSQNFSLIFILILFIFPLTMIFF